MTGIEKKMEDRGRTAMIKVFVELRTMRRNDSRILHRNTR